MTPLDLRLLGTAGPNGWPEPSCRCASCSRMRAVGLRLEPTRILLDGLPLDECAAHEVPGGHDIRTPGGGRVLLSGGPGGRPEPLESGPYDAVLLDLIGAPSHLGLLRHDGTVTERTQVVAVHVDHRISSPAELDRRLRWWTGRLRPRRVLVLGGSRSGKSEEAELRVAADPEVTYVATGRTDANDAEWQARIVAHRDRRPPWWHTVETATPHLPPPLDSVAMEHPPPHPTPRLPPPLDSATTELPPPPSLADVLLTATGTVLIDGMGSWLTSVFDTLNAWDQPEKIEPRVNELIDAWRRTDAQVVAVSDEVGLSVVPATSVGRAFRDGLGRLNQRLAAESEETTLVVAGRVVELT